MPQTAFQPAPRRALALAVGLIALAMVLEWSLRPLVGTRIPFLFFFMALGAAAMWLGWKPALIVLLGGLVNGLFWLEPAGLAVDSLPDRVSLLSYMVAGGLFVAMTAKFNHLRYRAVDAQQNLSGQVQDLQALQELGSRVALLPDLKAQLAAILYALCEMQHTGKGILWLFDTRSGTLRAAATQGFSEQARRALDTLPVGQGACGLAFLERRAVIVQDTETDPCFEAFRDLARQEGFRAVHSRPLYDMGGDIIGVLSLYFDRPREPTKRDEQLANLCGQMASVLSERETAREDAIAISRQVEVALESSAVPFCLFSPVRGDQGEIVDLRWEYLNGAAARVLGRAALEVAGRAVREVLPGAWDDPALFDHFVMALEHNATVEFEFRSGGRARPWFHAIASPCEGGLAVWFSDISERKHHEQMLREADQRKDEFLATLAHELRNPLAPIRQAALIARSPGARPEQRRWSLEVIDRQVGHMAVLLDDLLDVSRITRGKLELRKMVTDLREVVDSALEAARPAIEGRRQQLSVDWPETPMWALVDAMRMAQVVSNLLTNASKYTQPEGSIKVSGRHEDGEAVIEVVDNGSGIPPDALEKVFEMFTQVRNPHSAGTTGLGIGLALSRGLAEMHGATLDARSEGPGRGSTFTLRVPLCESPAKAQPDAPAGQHTSRQRRVLVADDNRDAAESLAEVLRIQGHEVALAFDGETALEQYKRHTPEVALLDIGMPRMNGNEVARAIRSSPEGEHTMLVAITGWGQERDRAAAKDAGFDFHFTKPVDPEQVLRLIAAETVA